MEGGSVAGRAAPTAYWSSPKKDAEMAARRRGEAQSGDVGEQQGLTCQYPGL